MAKVTMDTLLTKLSSVFKDDLYIINNLYCLGGTESENKNETQIVLQLSPQSCSVVKELFPDNNYVYIKNIKEAKKEFDKNVSFKIFESEKNDLQSRLNKVLDFVKASDTWENFNFTEEEAEYVFTDGYSLDIFGEDSGIPQVRIARNLFPLVTVKRLNTLL